MKNEYIIYNLVLERKPGDYNVIEINSIPNEYCTNDIGSIDSFTSKYTEEELRSLIEKNNLVEPLYLFGTFKIISNLKHNLKALTKEKFDIINDFANTTDELEQSFKDKLYGYFKKVVEKLDNNELYQEYLKQYKFALNTNNYKDVIALINKLPYAKARCIYFMIIDEVNKRQNNKIRKLEKIDDVA